MPDPDPNPDTVTITKADLATLQRSYKLLDSMWRSKEHGASVRVAAKASDPTLNVPEIDIGEPLVQPIRERQDALETENKTLAEKLAKLETDREDEKALDKLKGDLTEAQKKYRLTDEGMAEVRKIMAERSIADPMAAAAYVQSEIVQPAKPLSGSNFAPQDLNPFHIDGKAEDASTKALHEDPVKWQDREVANIMAEFEQSEAA